MDTSADQDSDESDSEFVEVDPSGRYGRYKKVLGKGAFKTVYWAFDELEGMEVAWNQVKLRDVLQRSDDLERLYSEVHLLKTLKHKNIIKFYNSWVDPKNKNINFITEIFTSGTLRQYRKRHKHVNMRAVKNWSRQILRGLLYLHSHDPPIIHRDLKCDNIFVNGSQGEVKIGDLGLAAILCQAHAAHSVIGTPEFMAPELYEEEYNELVDIYSFGMCLLEMITFEYPYSECANAAQIYKKVSSGIKPAALDKVKDPCVREFVEKCLATASRRMPARELLMDPFLQNEGECENINSVPCVNQLHCLGDDLKEFETISEELNGSGNFSKVSSMSKHGLSDTSNFKRVEDLELPFHVSAIMEPFMHRESVEVGNYCGSENYLELESSSSCANEESWRRSRDFKVKGKRKDDNTIFLRLRIADSKGHVRNIHFPFDVEADTAMTVASEMVAELDLSDQDVTTIAEMIDVEIQALVPEWKPGASFEDTFDDYHSYAFEDNFSDILSDGDNASGTFVLERLPSGRKYWSESPEAFVGETVIKTAPVNDPARSEGLMHGRFEEVTYHQSCSSSGQDRSDEINFSSESDCQGEDAEVLNARDYLKSEKHSKTTYNKKLSAIDQDRDYSYAEVVKSTVVSELKSQSVNLQAGSQMQERLLFMDHKHTDDSERGNGFNKHELAGQQVDKAIHEIHSAGAFQEVIETITDPLLEDDRDIAQELEDLAFRQQHEVEALKQRHEQALQDLRNRLLQNGCRVNPFKNVFSATPEMQCEFPVESSASFNNGSESERLHLTGKTTASARIKASLTERLDSGFLDGFDSTSSGDYSIPSDNFGVQALPSKRRPISTSRLGVNGKIQEQLSHKSQDGTLTQQIPDGRPKFDGYDASSSLSVAEMSAACQHCLSSKPANAIMGGTNGTGVRKKELSKKMNYMSCTEETRGLLSPLSRRDSVDAKFSGKVSLRGFHNRTLINGKEIENLAACNEVVVETVKNDSTSGLVGWGKSNGQYAVSSEKRSNAKEMRQLYPVKSTGPLERSSLADLLRMEADYLKLDVSAAKKCKQDAKVLQCELANNAFKGSIPNFTSAYRGIDKLSTHGSYIEFYKNRLSQRDKLNPCQGDVKASDLGCAEDSSGNQSKSKSNDKVMDQLKKQQLQKSIADLEAKTLEGLQKSKNSYVLSNSVKKQIQGGLLGSNAFSTKQQSAHEISRV